MGIDVERDRSRVAMALAIATVALAGVLLGARVVVRPVQSARRA